jgi:arginine repressor
MIKEKDHADDQGEEAVPGDLIAEQPIGFQAELVDPLAKIGIMTTQSSVAGSDMAIITSSPNAGKRMEEAIDHENWPEVAGTLPGDSRIFSGKQIPLCSSS